MTERGLVVNLRNAVPGRLEMEKLGATTYRSIIYGNDDLESFLPTMPPGTKLIAMLNNEHEEVGGDWSGWESAIMNFSRRFAGRVWAVEMANEWDIWQLPAVMVARLMTTASPYLQDAGMQRIMGGVAGSDWQNALYDFVRVMNPNDYDYANIHPYGQYVRAMGTPQPGFGPGLASSVQETYAITGKGVIVTEFGAKIADYGGEDRQAHYVVESYRELDSIHTDICPIACYFAWHDRVGTAEEQGENAFGLVDFHGNYRPAWDAYRSLTQYPVLPHHPDTARVLRVMEYAYQTPYQKPSRRKLLELIA